LWVPTNINNKQLQWSCNGLAQKDCLLTLYTGASNFQNCVWSAGSCSNPTSAQCEPSCFAGNRVTGTSCTGLNSATCNTKYTGGFGTSAICEWDSVNGICSSEACDYTCTGTYQKATTCTGLSKYECGAHYYDDGTNYNNCLWSGTACVEGQKCIKVCNGYISTANCSAVTTSLVCAQYYEVRGSAKYDCLWNSGTSKCTTKYPQECYMPTTPAPCPGTGTGFASCSSLYSTASACNSGSSWYDVPRFCTWNYGSNTCDNGAPCTP